MAEYITDARDNFRTLDIELNLICLHTRLKLKLYFTDKEKALPRPQFSPLQDRLHEQEKVLFPLSNKQEPPFRQLVIRHPCDKKIKFYNSKIFILSGAPNKYI